METNNNNTNNNNNSETATQSSHEVTAKQLKRQRIRQIVVSLIGVAILVWGIVKIGCMFMDYKSNEKSDDAQVEQYISPVNLRASGYIKKIYFKEHQSVKKGDTLLVLDNREYIIKVKEAEAALLDAHGTQDVIHSGVETSHTNVAVHARRFFVRQSPDRVFLCFRPAARGRISCALLFHISASAFLSPVSSRG